MSMASWLSFTAQAGTTYEVQRSGDLISGWAEVQSVEAMSESREVEIRLLVGEEGARKFYRVVAER